MNINDAAIAQLVKGLNANQSIAYINLSKNKITHQGIETVYQALVHSSVVDLDLSKNPLGDTGVKFLCNCLLHVACKLERLNISDCAFTD